MIMHSEWLPSFAAPIDREISARRMAEAFSMARGARAQVCEVGS